MQENIIIRRTHIGQLGSFLAGLGLLVGLIGFIWQGSLTAYVIAAFAISGLGLLAWALMTPADFKNVITGRQVRYSTMAIFSTLLMIGVVSLTYIIVQRQVIVADVTIDNRFTLSPITETVLDAARRSTRDIEITAFYYPTQVQQRAIDDQYWQLYEALSDGKIHRRYVNPLEEPAFSSRYMDAINQGVNVFVSYLNDDGTLDSGSTVPVASRDMQERDMTEALARLLARGAYKVYFERSLETPDPLDNQSQGFSLMNNLLRTNGFITDPLDLQALAQAGGSIPQDASAVVVARPRRTMTEAEIAVLDAYLDRGGSVLIAADVFFTERLFMADGSPLNEYLWQNYGLRMTEYVIVDPLSSARNDLEVISFAAFNNNRIAANLNIEGDPESVTLFNLARAIEVSDNPPVSNGRVIMTSPEAWGETDLGLLAARNDYAYDESTDAPGPLTTVAWANDTANDAKVVLIGDGDFLLNGQVLTPRGNATLFLDALGWLTGFTQEVEFEPRGYLTAPVMFISGTDLDLIAFVTVVFLPGTMLVAAAAIWARRLRQ